MAWLPSWHAYSYIGARVFAMVSAADQGRVPGRRIIDRELVEERIRVDAREAFDQMQVRGGSSETRLLGEIGRVDDKRLAFPMATRVPGPLVDPVVEMRTPVQRHDAGVVDHLAENDGVARIL